VTHGGSRTQTNRGRSDQISPFSFTGWAPALLRLIFEVVVETWRHRLLEQAN
jgi:hypothetical protein